MSDWQRFLEMIDVINGAPAPAVIDQDEVTADLWEADAKGLIR